MTTNWHRVQDIVDAILALPLDARAGRLDQMGLDPKLRSSVESLILSYQEASRFLEQPALASEQDQSTLDEDEESWTGRRIGQYQLVEKIGLGGMGTVYRAVRDDQQFDKQVAIKLLRGGFHSSFALARFKSERQILATLEHPNIARLLDGGTTDGGLPYFVMELVAGRPIDQYCEGRNLGIAERLRLFRIVCSAVQYAHQNLVIHRDLKPANILIAADAVPKLLDFGIAKILDAKAFRGEVEPTIPFLRLLTPEYASPEQMRGEAINTASDVYSLGVILYMLLSGHRPYRLAGLSTGEMCRVVSETEPAPPSVVVLEAGEALDEHGQTNPLTPESVSSARASRPDRLRRALAGDLDNIVLKALNKEPARRYPSVEQLSEDIRRYLEGLPVNARPDTLLYRAGKFVRRNKLSFAAGVLLFLSLTGGLAATLWQAHIARVERAKAEKRFSDVRELAKSLVFDVHDSIRDLPGATPARKLIVDRAVHYLDELSGDAAGDVALQRELAEAYMRLGAVQGGTATFNLGDTAGSIESYKKAIRLYEAIVARNPNNLEDVRGLARSYLATDSLDNSRRAVTLSERLLRTDPPSVEFREDLAVSYRTEGNLLTTQNDLNGALARYLQSLSLLQQLVDTNSKSTDYRAQLAVVQKNIGAVLAVQKKLPEALQHYQAALRLDKELSDEHPDNVALRYSTTFSYSDIGFILGQSGDQQGALANYRQALAIRESLSTADPKEVRMRGGVARTYNYIGIHLRELGRDEEALAAFRKSLAIREALMAADPANQTWAKEAAFSRESIGMCYTSLASKSHAAASKRIVLWSQARSLLQQALPVLQDLEDRHALVGDEMGAPENIRLWIQKCDSAIAKLQKTARVD